MSGLTDAAKEAFLSGDIALDTDTIKVVLLDLDDDGVAITNATNASPIVITSTSHGLTTGDKVTISNVGGNTAANAYWTVTVTDANTYSLDGSTGNGAYTSGGYGLGLSGTGFDNYDDITGAVGTPVALGTKTVTDGVFDAADATLTSVTGDGTEAILIYKDTGTPSTSTLIHVHDSGTGINVTPSGGDVTIQWNASGIFTL